MARLLAKVAERVLLCVSFCWAALAGASEPLRLPVTLIHSNPVTTITVGDQPVQAIVDTGGGVLMLSREVIDAAGGVKLADTQVSNDALGNEYVHARPHF